MTAVTIALTLCPQSAGAQSPINPVSGIGGGTGEGDLAATAGATGRATLMFVRDVDIRAGRFLISPGVGAGAGVESIARTGNGQDTSLDARFFIDAGPSLTIVFPAAREHTFSVTGEALYRYFVGELRGRDQLSGWQYRGTAGYQFTGERFGATATYDVSQRQQSPLEYIAGGGTEVTDIDARVNVLTQSAGASLRLMLGTRSGLRVAGVHRTLSYDEAVLAEELNRTETTVQAALVREMGSRTTGSLFTSFKQSNFTSDRSFRTHDRLRGGVNVLFGDGARSLRSGMPQTPIGPSEPIVGLIEAGIEKLTPHDETREGFTGPFAEGRVRFRLTPRMGLWAAADTRTVPTYWEENIFYVNRALGTGIDFWLFRGLNIGAFVDYARAQYPEAATFEQEDGTLLTAERSDKLNIYRGVVRFVIFGLPLAIQGGYFTRNSNFDIASSNGYFFRFGISADFRRNI